LNDTVNANFASNGGGVYWAGSGGSTFAVQNTILAANSATNTGPDANNPAGAFTDNGGNLIGISGASGGNSGFTAASQTGTLANPLNPLLGPLQSNGGPTVGGTGNSLVLETEAPLSGSPALGTGVAGAPGTDERGVVRPSVAAGGPGIDVGAFQFAPSIATFRASTGTWFLNTLLPPADTAGAYSPIDTAQFQFGTVGDIAVHGDWLGTGLDEVGVFRPSTGTWYLDTGALNYSASTTIQIQFGMSGDIPVVGHWLGTAISYVGVFRPSTGTWYLDTVMPAPGVPGNYSPAATIQVAFGVGGDIPVVGDWMGDGISRIGVFRPANGTWFLDEFGGTGNYRPTGFSAYSAATTAQVSFGLNGDIPVVGAWAGGLFDHIGVFRPGSGTWYLDTIDRTVGGGAYAPGTTIQVSYGSWGDIPVPGDGLGDSISRPAVFRPGSGTWFLDEQGSGGTIDPGTYRPIGSTAYDPATTVEIQFGSSGDQAEEGDWLFG
jgi:hypothetical protein